jgi:sugar/nucleoside kinase (ribokinase family)
MFRRYDVYGVGHALVDIQYSVPPAFLDRLGIEKGVMTLIDEKRQQAILAALSQPPVAFASGGSAANTMIGVARFGGSAYYTCQLGEDEWGGFYRQDLERAGVHSGPANRIPGRTGQCVVLITPDADRTLNTFLGVSSSIGPEQLEENVIAASQYLYVEGYLLSSESGFATCLQAQDFARRHGTAISLTLSDPSMVTSFSERFGELIEKGVDLLFCNEDEALAFTGCPDRQTACEALAERVETACITCGAEGAFLRERHRSIHVPGVQVEALDTTGAGDIFAGGVLFGVTNGHDLEEAGRLGSYAAARVVSQYGPRLERILATEIDAILAGFA